MSTREVRIESYEILRKQDGRLMIAFSGAEGHPLGQAASEQASLDEEAKTLALHFAGADVVFEDFDVPAKSLPTSFLVAEVVEGEDEPWFHEFGVGVTA